MILAAYFAMRAILAFRIVCNAFVICRHALVFAGITDRLVVGTRFWITPVSIRAASADVRRILALCLIETAFAGYRRDAAERAVVAGRLVVGTCFGDFPEAVIAAILDVLVVVALFLRLAASRSLNYAF